MTTPRILVLLALLFFGDSTMYEQSYRIASIDPYPAAEGEKVGYVTLMAVPDYQSPETVMFIMQAPAAEGFQVGDSITVTVTRRARP